MYFKFLHHYISIARIDHWFKNIFVLPGLVFAIVFSTSYIFKLNDLIFFTLGIFSICLIASANYSINELLDAEFDKFHPIKKYRSAATGFIKTKWALFQYFLLSFCGVFLATIHNKQFLLWSIIFLVMGIIYNVKPFRIKEKIYIDVLTESINNPIRFMLGWHLIIGDLFPPITILIGYWMGGAFLMSIKRLSEYRTILDKNLLFKYRQSFRYYNEQKLIVSSFLYALISVSSTTIFLIKYKIEFILCLPFYILIFAWYMKIGLEDNSIAQTPEKLYKKYAFMTLNLITIVLTFLVFFIEIPFLKNLIIPLKF
jgi:decaprenyl-phosphate phosphoribosyltransferase